MDNQLSELSEEERYRKRQLLVRPLVEALFAWLKKVRDEKMVPEGGKTMKGVNYYLNHEKQFLEFLNHGNVPLDNNATESALRNFCMHKHTWRLIDTINGAKASALVYSIVETAKANGLNPFRYLEFLLTEMMEHEEDTDIKLIFKRTASNNKPFELYTFFLQFTCRRNSHIKALLLRQSSKSVMLLRPLTCHIPVSPGLVARRAR